MPRHTACHSVRVCFPFVRGSNLSVDVIQFVQRRLIGVLGAVGVAVHCRQGAPAVERRLRTIYKLLSVHVCSVFDVVIDFVH